MNLSGFGYTKTKYFRNPYVVLLSYAIHSMGFLKMDFKKLKSYADSNCILQKRIYSKRMKKMITDEEYARWVFLLGEYYKGQCLSET